MSKELTLQEIFDICVGGLIKQRVPSITAKGCEYRRGDLKCVVGQLFDDTIDTEPFSYFWVTRRDPVCSPESALVAALTLVGVPLTESAYALLEEMQVIHDDTHSHVIRQMEHDCVIDNINDDVDNLRGNQAYEHRCVAYWKAHYATLAKAHHLNTDCFNV